MSWQFEAIAPGSRLRSIRRDGREFLSASHQGGNRYNMPDSFYRGTCREQWGKWQKILV